MTTSNNTTNRFFPVDIKIQFLKVPKKGSSNCNTGFGFCFTIVIVFIMDEGLEEQPETFFNEETGEMRGWGSIDLNNRDYMLIHFPSELAESPYHSQEDLMTFQVPEDHECGEITFVEGVYERTENSDGYNYEVKIRTQ